MVLHKKTQLIIPIGQICLGITQEDTTKNSNWNNLSWYSHKKIQLRIPIEQNFLGIT